MTQLRDLQKIAPEVVSHLLEEGYQLSDPLFMAESDIPIGDFPHDNQVSFAIQGRSQSGWVLISENDQVSYFPEKNVDQREGLFAPGISQWAQKIDPTTDYSFDVPRQWPTEIKKPETKQSAQAHLSIEKSTGTQPTKVFATTFLEELAQLPIGHPAKSFLESCLIELSNKIQRAKDRPEAADIYNEIIPVFQAMKSCKAYYEAGQVISHKFPHLQGKEEIKILYPGAGSNVGALSAAMALIDEGAPSVSLTFTDIDKDAPEDAKKIIEQWMKSNPDLQGCVEYASLPGVHNGQRVQLNLFYKGAPLNLTYALADSPQDSGLYFDPKTDLENADVVLIHDVDGALATPETDFLKQILPHLNATQTPKAIVMPNELNRIEPRNEFLPLESVLFVQGWRVNSRFGHGGDYPVRSRHVKDWDIWEIGLATNGSALVFSTEAPLIRSLKREDIPIFVDLALLAGGQSSRKYKDPGVYKGREIGMGPFMGKQKRANSPFEAITKWVDKTAPTLQDSARDLLMLTYCRYLSEVSAEELTAVPENLKIMAQAAMLKQGLMTRAESFDAVVKTQIIKADKNFFKKLDQALMNLQAL